MWICGNLYVWGISSFGEDGCDLWELLGCYWNLDR